MYAGFSYAAGVFAGTNMFEAARRRAAIGAGGSGMPYDLLSRLMPTEVDRKRRRRREALIAMRDDEDALMNV